MSNFEVPPIRQVAKMGTNWICLRVGCEVDERRTCSPLSQQSQNWRMTDSGPSNALDGTHCYEIKTFESLNHGTRKGPSLLRMQENWENRCNVDVAVSPERPHHTITIHLHGDIQISPVLASWELRRKRRLTVGLHLNFSDFCDEVFITNSFDKVFTIVFNSVKLFLTRAGNTINAVSTPRL